MLETKPLLEISSNTERAKGRGILASFSLLSFSLPPKPSWSQLARESGKVVCRGRMGVGWGMDQITSRQTTSIQAGVWGRVGERRKGVLTGRQSLMDPAGAAEQALHGGLKSLEHWTKLIFQSLCP